MKTSQLQNLRAGLSAWMCEFKLHHDRTSVGLFHQLCDHRFNGRGRQRVATGATGASDIDSDYVTVNIDDGAAAIAGTQHSVMLYHTRKIGSAPAQFTASGVHSTEPVGAETVHG